MSRTVVAHRRSGPLAGELVKQFDELFLILFARARRALGVGETNAAWHRAIGKLAGYLALLAIAVVSVTMLLTRHLLRIGPAAGAKRLWQTIGAIVFLLAFVALYRRFRPYSVSPPLLQPAESTRQARVILWFRGISIGAFLLALLLAMLVNLAAT